MYVCSENTLLAVVISSPIFPPPPFLQLVAFPALVSAGTASSHVSFANTTGLIPADIESARVTSKNLAGWVIFTAIMSMVYEGVVIALRFVNVDKVNDYIGVFFIAVSCSLDFDFQYECSCRYSLKTRIFYS